jgi:hypothetical protein
MTISVEVLAALITALLGFFGVIVTLAANGWLARRGEALKLTHERIVLRAALGAELRSLIKIMEEELQHIERANFTRLPLLDFFNAYKVNVGKLGLLTAPEVEALTTAYYTYLEQVGYINRWALDDKASAAPIPGYIAVDFGVNPDKRDWAKAAATTRNIFNSYGVFSRHNHF